MSCHNFLQEGFQQVPPQRKRLPYYGQRRSDILRNPHGDLQHTQRNQFSTIDEKPEGFHDTRLSDKATLGQFKADDICIEEHQRVVKENARLLKELQVANADVAKATQACQELAAWTYHERRRLLRELADVNLCRTQYLEQAVSNEQSVLAQAAMVFLEREVNNARAEVGLLPLSKEEMSTRLGQKDAETMAFNERQSSNMHWKQRNDETTGINERLDQADQHDSPDAEDFNSIAEQVDALIAEEKARLAIMD